MTLVTVEDHFPQAMYLYTDISKLGPGSTGPGI